MARQKKRGSSGQAKNYITRTQAVRKLQISLPDFRRLCIFKGIYPREPRNIKKANKSATHSTTFYYTKDIQYLLHEPLLAKFRDQKALQKKIAKSLGRNEVQDALRLEKTGAPKIRLDHIVRERYPTFVDALRDLDDALSLLFLFANLPSTDTVPPRVISKCQRLCHEFQHYLIQTNSLRKSFLSIKGIYYQATIQGQEIMWLVPYKFVQRVTQDVDYRIMGTFVEFYCTLLGFVNYKLYTSIGLVYPPKFDQGSDERGAELAAFTLEGRNVADNAIESAAEPKQLTNGHRNATNPADVQAQIDRIAEEEGEDEDEGDDEEADDAQQLQEELIDDIEENTTTVDKFQPAAPGGDVLPQPEASSNEAARLFADYTVYISREAPRAPIEFLLRAFGCKRIGWDRVLGEGAFTFDEHDPRITHQVVDKPLNMQNVSNGGHATADNVRPGYMVPGRLYVQPQWVWDCVNEGTSLRTDIYAPGAELPPHLSPWMKPDRSKGQYDPRASLEEQQAASEEDDDDDELSETEARQLLENAEPDVSDDDDDDDEVADTAAEGMQVDMAETSSSSEEDEDLDQPAADLQATHSEDDDDEEEVEEETTHQAELAAEASGTVPGNITSSTKSSKNKKKQERASAQKKEEEEKARQMMMMSNKKRKLYEKMQHGNVAKDAEAEKLRRKRRKIEAKRQR